MVKKWKHVLRTSNVFGRTKKGNENEKAIENKPDFDTKNKNPIKNVDKKTETFILIVCGQSLVDEVA